MKTLTPATPSEFYALFLGHSAERLEAFQDYWLVFQALAATEDALVEADRVPCRSDRSLHEGEDCPHCTDSGRRYEVRSIINVQMLQLRDELLVVRGMHESATKPPAPGSKFYITTSEGHLLAGPFDTHERALRLKRTVQDMAEDANPTWTWKSYGTASMPPKPEGFPEGFFNAHL